jgi:hypothetical protein
VGPDAYTAFTDELVRRAAARPEVVGLVALGSMAARDYGPDEWSDHDFFLVTEPGGQEAFRSDLSWLPSLDRVVLAFRETAHGLKVVYDDGHLLEFAVFDIEEIGVASVNRYRVLLDRGGVGERMAEVAARPRERQSDEYLFGMVVTGALVGAGRARRGEVLSGASFVVGAVRPLAALLARAAPSPEAALLDDLDPLRRFERVHPRLGSELAAALERSPADAAALLLDVADAELRAPLPDLPWAALDAVRARL